MYRLKLDEVFADAIKSELSMIEVAHAILDEKGETMAFVDIVNEIQTYLGKTDGEIRDRLPQFYTDLNENGSFISLGDNVWGLRAWYPYESVDEEVNQHDDEEDAPRRKKRKKVNAFLADAGDDDDVIDYNDDDPEDDDLTTTLMTMRLTTSMMTKMPTQTATTKKTACLMGSKANWQNSLTTMMKMKKTTIRIPILTTKTKSTNTLRSSRSSGLIFFLYLLVNCLVV